MSMLNVSAILIGQVVHTASISIARYAIINDSAATALAFSWHIVAFSI